jgi:hypothetical protein
MRVVCAWCQDEGRSRLLRVGEPLEDTSETHGICNRHQQEIFEILSFDPMAIHHVVGRRASLQSPRGGDA